MNTFSLFGLLFISKFYLLLSASVDANLLALPQILRLDEKVSKSYLIKHDFLRCFKDGEFANMTDASIVFAKNHFVYSSKFLKYLQMVASKIENATIKEPILENIAEETGNYEESDLLAMEKIGIKREWFNRLTHKKLLQRFKKALQIGDLNPLSKELAAGHAFTEFMLNLYSESNVCESLAIIGFAIEETVSKLYDYIWKGLSLYTSLEKKDTVFFPLHILLDDGHADLLKLGFKYYLQNSAHLCENAENIVMQVLDERIKMFDSLRLQIEETQNHKCKYDYSPLSSMTKNSESDCDSKVKTSISDTNAMKFESDNWSNLEKMAISARILAKQGHGQTLSGQITCRESNDESNGETRFWSNAYGKTLELVTENDFVLVNSDLNVVKGTGFASKATNFHLHVYDKRPDINCMIHTHPPKTSALAISGHPLIPLHMDTMAFYNDVQFLAEWPGIPFGNEEGEIISSLLSDKYMSALLSNHGLIVAGKNIEEVTYRAYFFERAAEMQLEAMQANGGQIEKLKQVQHELAMKAKTWRLNSGPVRAHFNAWAQMLIADGYQL